MASIVLWYEDPVPKVSAIPIKDIRPTNAGLIQEKARCEGKFGSAWYPCLVVHLDRERTKLELERQLLTGRGQKEYFELGVLYLNELEKQANFDVTTQQFPASNEVLHSSSASSTSLTTSFTAAPMAIHTAPHSSHRELNSPLALNVTPLSGFAGGYGNVPQTPEYHNYMPHSFSHYNQQPTGYHPMYGQPHHSSTNGNGVIDEKSSADDVENRVQKLETELEILKEQVKKIVTPGSGFADKPTKDPVLIQMLCKHHISFAVREGMRNLFTKDEMLVSVLSEKNIKSSKTASQVIDATVLDRLQALTDAFAAEKKLQILSKREFRDIVSIYLQEVKNVESRKNKPKKHTAENEKQIGARVEIQ